MPTKRTLRDENRLMKQLYLMIAADELNELPHKTHPIFPNFLMFQNLSASQKRVPRLILENNFALDSLFFSVYLIFKLNPNIVE